MIIGLCLVNAKEDAWPPKWLLPVRFHLWILSSMSSDCFQVPYMHYFKARIFLLVDLRGKKFRFRVGGREKKTLKMTSFFFIKYLKNKQ